MVDQLTLIPAGPSAPQTIASAAAMATGEPTSASSVYPSLEAVREAVCQCTQCPLHSTRTQTVFSDGNPAAPLMLIGEGPGQQEDETGIPFVGRAGQLLTQILQSVQISRQQDIYICNIVKCRPPNNRVPAPAEMAACANYLYAQIALIQPRLILLAGATAVRGILKNDAPISRIRGQWLETPFNGAKAMPIFHPSYLLRNPSKEPNSPKWLMWQDIQAVRKALDETGWVVGQGWPQQ
ncbi:MAG: uracil-DNA glycosylase [Candidatus Melainabacteria bacterium]|nr:uracil-DNA glycosylase [Candidatus Melainabacteria bacterium]